jgi:hypothetical protein
MAADSSQKYLSELETLADTLGVRVSYEPMSGLSRGSGGLCKVRGELRVIMDRKLKPVERMQVLADALRRFDTESVYVSPAVRRMLVS